jgi:hypothetical protein
MEKPSVPFEVIPLSELKAEPVGRWGDWVFDRDALVLTHEGEGYEIDLTRIRASAAILDWVFQLHHKAWADARTMNDLLAALDAVLRPQTNYCGDGSSRRKSGRNLARAYAARLAG